MTANLRSVRLTYSTGAVIETSMAANLTDEEILAYYEIGKPFNIGKGPEDLIATVQEVEILDRLDLISDRRIAELLCTAWEGASTSWVVSSGGVPYRDVNGTLSLRLPVRLRDVEGDVHTLDQEAIRRAVVLLKEDKHKRFRQEIEEQNEDGYTADAFLQLAIFGELVYG